MPLISFANFINLAWDPKNPAIYGVLVLTSRNNKTIFLFEFHNKNFRFVFYGIEFLNRALLSAIKFR